jgi:RNA polymerase sigma-70 factor (ECF subfamily)
MQQREQQQQPLTTEQLYIAYYPRIVNFIRSLAKCSYEEAEDLAQDTFIKAIQAFSTLDKTRSHLSWLYQIARNTTYDSLRRKKRAYAKGAVEMPEDVEYAVSDSSDLEEEVATRECVLRALQAISPRYRDALLLQGIGGCCCEDIAKVLGLTLGNTRTSLVRARAAFKQHYEEVLA